MQVMLAGNATPNDTLDDLDLLKWPMYMSAKLDGIRAAVDHGVVYSRSWKPIANQHVQRLFGRADFQTLDGELIMGSRTDDNVMQKTSSAVNSEDGEPDVDYYVFDLHSRIGREDAPFSERWEAMQRLEVYLKQNGITNVKVVPQRMVYSAAEARIYLQQLLDEGYEGAMLRKPGSPYKYGRSTYKEAYLLKVKVWAEAEATILAIHEGNSNQNPLQENELGKAKRSSHKAGMVPNGMLGSMDVRDLVTGVEFNIGRAVKGAWTAADLQELWENREKYVGKIITYRHFPKGIRIKPRFPQFKAFRDPSDM